MNFQQKKGFTLIEVVAVIAIIGIMSTIILSRVNSGRTEESVNAATRGAVATLREMQQYALTGKQFVQSTDPCRYDIAWNGGSASYTATYYYKNSSGVCNQSATIATYTLSDGATFQNSSSFGFTLPYGKPTFGAASVGLQITKGGVNGVACVYKDGLIKSAVGSSNCP